MITLKKILVPHDFSDTSYGAVRYAIALAHNFGAQLHLLHVSDKARFEMATEFPLGLDGTLEDAVRERLLKILTPREQVEFKPTFEFRSGSPAAEIVKYAKDADVDLIVMGITAADSSPTSCSAASQRRSCARRRARCSRSGTPSTGSSRSTSPLRQPSARADPRTKRQGWSTTEGLMFDLISAGARHPFHDRSVTPQAISVLVHGTVLSAAILVLLLATVDKMPGGTTMMAFVAPTVAPPPPPPPPLRKAAARAPEAKPLPTSNRIRMPRRLTPLRKYGRSLSCPEATRLALKAGSREVSRAARSAALSAAWSMRRLRLLHRRRRRSRSSLCGLADRSARRNCCGASSRSIRTSPSWPRCRAS